MFTALILCTGLGLAFLLMRLLGAAIPWPLITTLLLPANIVVVALLFGVRLTAVDF